MATKYLTNRTVANTVRAIKRAETVLALEYGDAKAALRKQLADIRGRCEHAQRTYHPDPSGNNDSSYSCDVCGLETNR